MSEGHVTNASKWFYRGLWGVLSRWFHVPEYPPTLPNFYGEEIKSFKPAESFITYLKFQFWIGMIVFGVTTFGPTAIVTMLSPYFGVTLAVVALLLAAAIISVAYLAIHLRYDTTWYVMSDRSLRIRRGIWLIRETTITFENVQNVGVRQGPLQRFFGISDVLVETAGGGGAASAQQGGHGGQGAMHHRGLIEGVANAEAIRDALLKRLRQSRTAGLGDESDDEDDEDDELHETSESGAVGPQWTEEHLALLREIRDAAIRI